MPGPGDSGQIPGGRGSGEYRLETGFDTIWPPRERLTARCRLQVEHSSPDSTCSCGIYAALSHRILRAKRYAAGPDSHQAPDIVGQVWLWGRVLISDEIARAQFAYPKRLIVPYMRWRWARRLEEIYGVAVEVKNPFTMRVD